MVVYIAYEKKYPYLPIAVADTPAELAKLIGVHRNNILSPISRLKSGQLKSSRYHRVEIEDAYEL